MIIKRLKRIFKPLDDSIGRVLEMKADNFYVVCIRYVILFLLFIFVLPFILTSKILSICDFTETGQIGDTIGGVMAPFIGIIAGILTFMAFHEQYRANDEAKKDLEKERFESKFYNFLSLLNNLEINTTIPHVGNYKQAFHFMFYEYKAIAVLIYRKLGRPTFDVPKTEMLDSVRVREDGDGMVADVRAEILKEAFNIFINGVSRTATSRMKEYVDGSESMNDYFLELQYLYKKPKNPNVPYLGDYETIDIKLFDGHRLRLISFFRLVCKIIEFIYQDGGDDKEIYLSTLLSLLSEHQIALLKLLYVYDKVQNSRFIVTNSWAVDSFFMDPYDGDYKKVCLSKYIFSETMDCTKAGFIKFDNSVGEIPVMDKK